MSRLRFLLIFISLAGTLLACDSAHAAPPERDRLSSNALRDVFVGRRATNALLFPETGPIAQWKLTTGVAYADNGDGNHTTGLPAELEVNIKEGSTVLLIDADWYDWVNAGSGSLRGYGDPTFSVVHRAWSSEDDKIAVAGGVTVPGGSDVSAGSAAQFIELIYGHSFGAVDSVQLKAELGHDNGTFSPGVSAYSTTGKLYYEHDFTERSDVFATAAYTHQSGAGNVTTVGFGIDFQPVPTPVGPFKWIGATIQGSCGVSGGHHCGTIEFDVVLPFR